MRFEYFLDDFKDNVSGKFEIYQMTQMELKVLVEDNLEEFGTDFPMICYEHTNDSPEEVNVDDSKFLNDKEHDGVWILGKKNGEWSFIICLKDDEGELEIDTFEVAVSERGNKIASYVIDGVEYASARYYDTIYISPFDTDAMNFWSHMGYVRDYGGYYSKSIEDDEDF